MDVRSITTPAFPVLTRTQSAPKKDSPAEEAAEPRKAQSSAGTRHPALTAEEQRYFDSAFPAPAADQAPTTTYSGGGAMRQQMKSGTIVDRKV
jgi:hypothetical protein